MLPSNATTKGCHDNHIRTPEGGEGMEWHSDGAEGEYTVLFSLDNITVDQGTLGVVPGSHSMFVPGVGHGDLAHNDYSRSVFPSRPPSTSLPLQLFILFIIVLRSI